MFYYSIFLSPKSMKHTGRHLGPPRNCSKTNTKLKPEQTEEGATSRTFEIPDTVIQKLKESESTIHQYFQQQCMLSLV